jgi:hypothetical protein
MKWEDLETENDTFVKENIRRLPWWVMPWMIYGKTLFSDRSLYVWNIPGCRMLVRRLKRGKKGYRGKLYPKSIEIFSSTSVRKAIERWGGK